MEREKTPIIDSIYRRIADLLRMDEALLRYRDTDEVPELPTKMTIAESLQLVHYAHAQEYTAVSLWKRLLCAVCICTPVLILSHVFQHHDFGFSRIDDDQQGARFSTVLLYLNEGMVGGETSFPRCANAETFKGLDVKPEKGKAVLFYSQLPGTFLFTFDLALIDN